MSKECIQCYIYTGFRNYVEPHNEHTHEGGKIVFKYSLEERVKGDLDESEKRSSYTYFGNAPFHAEGTTLARIIARKQG